MKALLFVSCLLVPLWAHTPQSVIDSLIKTKETTDIEEQPEGIDSTRTTDIDVNNYRGPLQNLKSNIPEDALLKKVFNGVAYEILTSKNYGIQDYATLDYNDAFNACKNLPNSGTLLTFKSAEENAFVANWLFEELKIVTQVWIGLTRVNGTNDFVWADGTALTKKNEEKLFKNWHKCEPNDITTTSWDIEGWGENCVEMYSSYYPYPLRCDELAKAGQWNDIPCEQIHNMVVCQRKKKTISL